MIWAVVGILVVLVGGVLFIFNKLVRGRILVDEGWSGIDIQLKKRWDLVPNLVSTVQGYAAHEKETLDKVTQYRGLAMGAKDLPAREEAENMLTGALKTLFAVAENYPNLKANENFLELQKQLAALEDDIEAARRYYNGAVRDYTIAIGTFPNLVVAKLFGFGGRPYFQLSSEEERAVPKAAF